MAFERHREQEKSKFEKAIEETAEKKSEGIPKVEIPKVEIPEAEIPKEEIPEAEKKITVKKDKETISEKEEVNNCGIVGNTIEVREFRAIVKKRGEQINVVLTKLISNYNSKNYNL